MKWSVKLGRFAGIDVYLHVTFLLLLAFVAAAHVMAGASWSAALSGVGFVSAVFGCVLLHEFGHALVARRFGVGTRDITLLPIGGVARLEHIPEQPMAELWIALAGPAVNVVIALLLVFWLLLTGGISASAEVGLAQGPMAMRLLLVNVTLVVFNLIPAFPMDGGRVLRALLALRLEYSRATQIAASLGQGIALVFALLGLLGLLGGSGNPMLLFIALFVWIGASQEAGLAQFRSSLGGARVRDAMLTSFLGLGPRDPLARAVELVMAGSQADFPVIEAGRVVGILTRQRLLTALAEHGKAFPVGAAMDCGFRVVQESDSLEAALLAEGGRLAGPVPVLRGGALVGLLTGENVSDYVLIQTALRTPRRAAMDLPPILSS